MTLRLVRDSRELSYTLDSYHLSNLLKQSAERIVLDSGFKSLCCSTETPFNAVKSTPPSNFALLKAASISQDSISELNSFIGILQNLKSQILELIHFCEQNDGYCHIRSMQGNDCRIITGVLYPKDGSKVVRIKTANLINDLEKEILNIFETDASGEDSAKQTYEKIFTFIEYMLSMNQRKLAAEYYSLTKIAVTRENISGCALNDCYNETLELKKIFIRAGGKK